MTMFTLTSENFNCIKSKETFLSPGVLDLWGTLESCSCDSSEKAKTIDVNSLDNYVRLEKVSTEISKILNEPEKETAASYRAAVSLLSAPASEYHLYYSSLPWSRLRQHLRSHLFYFSNIEALESVLERVHGDDATADVTCHWGALRLTALLERALGDLYLVRGQQCPSMLKDILTSPELKDLLGQTPVSLLRVLLGPPISLNLRNITWHGFTLAADVKPQFVWLLVAAACFVGHVLACRDVRDIPHRSDVMLTYLTELHHAVIGDHDLKETLPDLEHVFRSSSLVHGRALPVLQFCLAEMASGRPAEAVMCLLPQLEHLLRLVFAVVNDCPDRVLTAESTVLFTTLNEMLSREVGEGQLNKLPQVLGEPLMDLLLDLLQYPEGPRLRDRLGHGETWSLSPPSADIAHRVAGLLLLTCAAVCWKVEELEVPPSLQGVLGRVAGHVSLCHPVAALQRALVTLDGTTRHVTWPQLQQLMEMMGAAAPDDAALVADVTSAVSRVLQRFPGADLQLKPEDLCGREFNLHDVINRRQSTLFRFLEPHNGVDEKGGATEEELVGLLRRVSHHLASALQEVEGRCSERLEQLEQRQLRSRQRANLSRLLTCVPCLVLCSRTLLLQMTLELLQLSSFPARDTRHRQAAVRKYRGMLQCAENLVTYCSRDKNKWDEAATLLRGQLGKL